jgi:hypothetical protein
MPRKVKTPEIVEEPTTPATEVKVPEKKVREKRVRTEEQIAADKERMAKVREARKQKKKDEVSESI